MSPSRGFESWNSEYTRADWQPGYGQAPNRMHTDYQFSSREYQSYPPQFHAHERARDGFYADDYNPRHSHHDYPDNYADSSRVPGRRRSPDYGEYHRGEDHYSQEPYEGGSWVESERDFRPSWRSFDYSTPPSSRSYDSPPPGSRAYHSRARDYDGYAHPPDASRERDIPRGGYDNYRQQWSGSENDRRREDDRGDAFDDRNSRNSGYSNYRRPLRREDNTDRHMVPSLRGRSPPHPDRNNSTQDGRKFTPRFDPRPSRPSPGPLLPPRRTNPTTEYIEVSQEPPTYLLDPTLSRKLIVLDLNGSLVLRAAHTARVPPTRKGGSGHPYDNPTQPRPLRAVHPRPYLKTFTTYLLHDETKKWLDTMVWSSAQPHSVDDMVGKTFLERKDELAAVWARDTLGLTTEEYCKSSLPFINSSRVDFSFLCHTDSKSLTIKDLAKPWAELPTLRASYLTEEKPFLTKSPSPRIPTTKPVELIEPTDPRPQRHSALSSLLVDDSPLKAALQPWNHLCILEYVQETRRQDLEVAEREVAGECARKAAEDREAFEKKLEREKQRLEGPSMGNGGGGAAKESEDVGNKGEGGREPVRRVFRELVMVDGEMVDTAEVLKQVSREVVMIDGQMINPGEDPIAPTPLVSTKHQNRRLKRLTKKLEMKKAREDKEKGMFELSKQETEAKVSRGAADAQGGGETSTLHPFKGPEMRYDETLLAVIGVLDQIKHESNVAGWMRSGGLLRVAHPPTPPCRLDGISKAEKRPATSRDGSPSGEPGPTKKRRIHSNPDDSDTDLEIQPPPPSSPPSNIRSSPQIYETDVTTPAENGPSREEDKKEQASTGIPLSPPPLRSGLGGAASAASGDVGPKDLWYQDHSVHKYWAERGRRALEALGIEIESGIEPVPGGLSPRDSK